MSSPSQHQSNDRPKRHGRRARRVVASDDPSVLRCRYLCLVSILSGLLCHRASASFSSLNLRPSIGPKASSRNKSLAPGRRPAVSPDSGKLPLQVADRSRGSPNLSEGAVFKSWFSTSSKSWFTNLSESWFANLARAVPDSRRSKEGPVKPRLATTQGPGRVVQWVPSRPLDRTTCASTQKRVPQKHVVVVQGRRKTLLLIP